MSGGRRDNAAIIGVGAVACATCCAGPVLAFLGGACIASSRSGARRGPDGQADMTSLSRGLAGALLIVAAGLFAIGVANESNSESTTVAPVESAGTHVEAGETTPSGRWGTR